MEADIQHSLARASGACMAEAIQGIATRMEDAVAKVVTPPQVAWATSDGPRAPHTAIIKQLHYAH